MIKRITSGWNGMRLFRMGIGTAAMVQGAMEAQYALVVAGVIVGILALLNVGCCGPAGCKVSYQTKQKAKPAKVIYEDVGEA